MIKNLVKFEESLKAKYGDIIASSRNTDNTIEGYELEFRDDVPEEVRALVLDEKASYDFAQPVESLGKLEKEVSKDQLAFTPLMRLTQREILELPRDQRDAAFERWCKPFSPEEKALIKSALASAGVIIE